MLTGSIFLCQQENQDFMFRCPEFPQVPDQATSSVTFSRDGRWLAAAGHQGHRLHAKRFQGGIDFGLKLPWPGKIALLNFLSTRATSRWFIRFLRTCSEWPYVH
jgi:hypothetical protein